MGCDQLLCNDVNCTDVFTTGVDASGAMSCAALTATGTVAGAALSSTGAVSGSSLSISGAASVGLLSSATGITGSTLTINNTANAGNFTTVGDVSTGTLTASGAATAASFAATGAVTGATLTVSGAASTGPLDCESLRALVLLGLHGVEELLELRHVGLRHLRLHPAVRQIREARVADHVARVARDHEAAGVPLVRGQGQLRGEALGLHQRLVVDHDELALVRPAVPLQEDPRALVAQQPQLRAAVGGRAVVGHLQLAPARPVLRQEEIVREVGGVGHGERVGREEHMNGDLRLGFAEVEKPDGTARWSDGTEMVTLDYSHTSVLWGVCKGFQARLDEVEAWQAQRGPKNK